MPTLKLTRQGLSPTYSAATLDYILSIMVWPVECDMRIEFQRSCAALERKAAAAAVPGRTVDGWLFDELADVLPPRLLAKEMQPHMERGYRVGYFYACVCSQRGWMYPDAPVSLTQLRARMTAPEHRKLHAAMNVGDKLLERDLQEFRAVGHLWAALFLSVAEKLDCFSPEKLAEFLALSEWVRRLLEKAPSKKGVPVLPRDADLWCPPAWLSLPAVNLVPSL